MSSLIVTKSTKQSLYPKTVKSVAALCPPKSRVSLNDSSLPLAEPRFLFKDRCVEFSAVEGTSLTVVIWSSNKAVRTATVTGHMIIRPDSEEIPDHTFKGQIKIVFLD
jgi:hypothetical protein